jgi:hypothetical protein
MSFVQNAEELLDDVRQMSRYVVRQVEGRRL